MPIDNRRISAVTDDKLVIHSNFIHATFQEHYSHFADFAPKVFTAEYHLHFQKAIDEASDQVSDEFVVQEQVQETAEVKEAIEDAMLALKELKYFVGTIFTESQKAQKRFNLTNFSKRKMNVDKLIAYLYDVNIVINSFSEKLIEGGYSDEKITLFKKRVDYLNLQRQEQKEIKIRRTELTHERIEKMNNLWQKLCDISNAAEIIFARSEEKQRLFSLPRKSKNDKKESSVEE